MIKDRNINLLILTHTFQMVFAIPRILKKPKVIKNL